MGNRVNGNGLAERGLQQQLRADELAWFGCNVLLGRNLAYLKVPDF